MTANLNGIRAAARKGFFPWLQHQAADIVCLQETKAQKAQLTDPIFQPTGYHCYYHDAVKKGYSGVALYSKVAPQHVQYGIGWEEVDCEGRYLAAQFQNLTVISLYLHSGTAGSHRQTLKYAFMDKFLPYLKDIRASGQPHIICGDWNIAHKPIDLKNWKSNQKHSGFLPEERAWLDQVFDEAGFIDAFRVVNQAPDQYTWWSNRGQAWANNVGWRIDYQIISPELADTVQAASIYKAERFSDHAPLTIDYAWTVV
jgi:exodeoxyribonuclease-3